ncbi:hypothetical protein C3B44_11350 [Corynebacterium yudongzhengii]|nr:hypothetical protein C3B44_11350 [Corynebacterium yudongzhengii]
MVGEDRPGPHDEVAAAAMRVAQEALANALRHAEASRIAVTYVVLDDEITLDIVDDGRGFDPAATERTSEHGFGLRGLDARVRETGGVLTVESTPARGTAVAASFPLHASDKEQP